jgi:hypothetical protein
MYSRVSKYDAWVTGRSGILIINIERRMIIISVGGCPPE